MDLPLAPLIFLARKKGRQNPKSEANHFEPRLKSIVLEISLGRASVQHHLLFCIHSESLVLYPSIVELGMQRALASGARASILPSSASKAGSLSRSRLGAAAATGFQQQRYAHKVIGTYYEA